jgi:hypothetical protein
MPDRGVRIKPFKTETAIIQTERDGRPEVLVVNKALRDFAHPEVFRWHLSIAIPAHAFDKTNGMPAPEEIETLNEVSDAVATFVLANRTERGAPNVLFLAHSTWRATRELMFRVHDGDLALTLLAKKTWESWKRDWEFQLVEDPEWKLAKPVTGLFATADRAEGWQAF